MSKNFVVQRAIIQDKWFEAISPGSVSPLRVTTGLPAGGSPRFCASLLRLGRKGSKFVFSSESLKIPVINSEGTIGKYAFNNDWIRYDRHPDTEVRFEGMKIPNFSKAVSFCEELHKKIPQFTIIGWDIAINEKGEIELMEWNTLLPGIAYSEATTGPNFKHLNLERFA